MKLKKLKPLTDEYLSSIGFTWYTDEDKTAYVADEVVSLSGNEAEAFYDAANELYDMYINAAEYVIEKDLFHELNIPFNLVELIKESWENDVHWHLYGRFDLAGGLDGKPIKLIEFNADTPTALYETAIIQWALLKANSLDETSQFNSLYEALIDNFKRFITLDTNVEKFGEYYKDLNWKILFSSISGHDEEEHTTRLLQHIASEAGYETEFEYIQDVEFSDEGISKDGKLYEFWFKLIPWEDIAIDEGELAVILTEIITNKKAIVFNPAYTLLFQSKGILKILWDLYPHHPLLLETSFEPLENTKQVEKPCFGREGANVAIVNSDNSLDFKTEGPYENFKMVYQEYYEFNKDGKGDFYQAGVFYAYEPCGLGFRKGDVILDNRSKFVGHIVED
jgi:glutathionylspermidine synthase